MDSVDHLETQTALLQSAHEAMKANATIADNADAASSSSVVAVEPNVYLAPTSVGAPIVVTNPIVPESVVAPASPAVLTPAVDTIKTTEEMLKHGDVSDLCLPVAWRKSSLTS